MHEGSETLLCFHHSASPSSSQPGSGSLTAIKESLDMEETTFICTQHQALPEWQLERRAKSECINCSCPWEPISYLLPVPFQNEQLTFLVLSSGWERGRQSSLIWGSLVWFVRLPPWLLFCSCQTRAECWERQPRLSGALRVLWRCSDPLLLGCTWAKSPSAHGGDYNPSNLSDSWCQGDERLSLSENKFM